VGGRRGVSNWGGTPSENWLSQEGGKRRSLLTKKGKVRQGEGEKRVREKPWEGDSWGGASRRPFNGKKEKGGEETPSTRKIKIGR